MSQSKLKKPSQLFENKSSKKILVNADEDFRRIKDEFNKVEDIREQLNTISNSLTSTLSEVVDKNFKSIDDYSDVLEGFNKRIDAFQKEIIYKIDDIEKSNQVFEGEVYDVLSEYGKSNTVLQDNVSQEISNVKSEVTVFERHQKKIVDAIDTQLEEYIKKNTNLEDIKEEVLSGVQNILSGDVVENINRLERKIEFIRDTYKTIDAEAIVKETLKEGLLNEPPNVAQSIGPVNGVDPLTPTDKNFVTFRQLQDHYKLFLNRIIQQVSVIGGGGENNYSGWEYISDKNLESNPITLVADTWTQVTNDGTSSSTSRDCLPRDQGVTAIYNTTTNRIDFSQLSNKAHVIFRFGIKVNPTVDNTTLKLRLFWTMSTGSTYEVDVPGALLNDGAGIEYENEFTLPFYVGNDITKNGYGIVQVKADGDCTITDSAFLTIVG